MKAKLIKKIKNEQKWYVYNGKDGLVLYGNEVAESYSAGDDHVDFFDFDSLTIPILEKIAAGEIEPCNAYYVMDPGSMLSKTHIQGPNVMSKRLDFEMDKFVFPEKSGNYEFKIATKLKNESDMKTVTFEQCRKMKKPFELFAMYSLNNHQEGKWQIFLAETVFGMQDIRDFWCAAIMRFATRSFDKDDHSVFDKPEIKVLNKPKETKL
jgi:hypothetical protein